MSEDHEARVLIIDRELGTLTAIDSLLSRMGCRVTTCCSFEEALKAVAGQRLDLVVAGRVGLERDGAALVARVKDISPGTPVLLLVESDEDRGVGVAIAAGADGLLRRSYSDSQMIQRVDRLLRAVPSLGPRTI